MTTPNVVSGRMYKDNEITQQILEIINKAESNLAIVSPYIDRVLHVEQAITRAITNGVEVTIFARKDGARIGGNRATDALAWFKANKVKVVGVPNLHAKFYINETEAVVTSMNLYTSSWTGSLELGFAVEGEAHAQLAAYLRDIVMPQSKSVVTKTTATRTSRPPKRATKSSTRRPSVPAKKEPSGFFGSVMNVVKDALESNEGFCIRCGERLTEAEYESGKALCRKDYRAWAEFKRPAFTEKFCTTCGKSKKTSFARPQCRECFADNPF